MNKELSEKIIEEIKGRGIEPRPKWQFLLKRWVLWLLATIATLFGSIAVAVIIFVYIDYDASARVYLHESIFEDLLQTMPFLWIATLALLIGITQYALRHTKFGYRYRTSHIVTGVVIVSVLLGILLSIFEVGERMQNFLAVRVPFYNQLSSTSKDVWSHPEQGLLGGTVSALAGEEELTLTDFKGKMWLVDRGNIDPSYDLIITPGAIVKLVGTQETNAEFRAVRVFPWHK